MFRCGWCGTDDHDKCKPYVIGPIAQIWWCKCECDTKRESTHKVAAEKASAAKQESLVEEPKRKRRKRKVG